MTQAITQRDLDGMFVRFVRAAEANGAATMSWRLTGGSKINGVAYEVQADYHSSNPPGTSNHWRLGLTKREAYDRLHTAAIALEQVEYWRGES